LASQAKVHRSILELGSYFGRSTIALAENTDGIVYAVDDFYGPRNDGVNEPVRPDLNRDKIYDEFIKNTVGLKNIKVIHCDHKEFRPTDSCDMVFIDGSHIYEDVKADISKFLSFKHVLLSGHDI